MIIPDKVYNEVPCSVVAVGTALGKTDAEWVGFLWRKAKLEGLKPDGYLSLDGMNQYIRENLKVRKKTSYKRGERPFLKDFLKDNKGRYIICVYGHYIYANGGEYYSFFNNDRDPVVATWELFTI